jgi:hypothetical protein
MPPTAATSINAVVVGITLFYHGDGRPDVVLTLADGRRATMTTEFPEGTQSLPEAIYEHVKQGAQCVSSAAGITLCSSTLREPMRSTSQRRG